MPPILKTVSADGRFRWEQDVAVLSGIYYTNQSFACSSTWFINVLRTMHQTQILLGLSSANNRTCNKLEVFGRSSVMSKRSLFVSASLSLSVSLSPSLLPPSVYLSVCLCMFLVQCLFHSLAHPLVSLTIFICHP